jgi:hypothetical protein
MASCTTRLREKVSPVEGQVLFHGQPAAGAIVVFHPRLPSADRALEAVHPMGIVGEDGSFTLSSFGAEDGAPPGEYVVTITWPFQSPPATKTAGQPKKGGHADRLKGRYNNSARSPLRARVEEGKNYLHPFEIH